jgi:hypothetical protein
MERMRWTQKALGVVLVITLTMTGCAASNRGSGPAGSRSAATADLMGQCDAFATRLDYANKSVAGRSAATAALAPLAVGVGLLGFLATANPGGIVLAVEGPAQLIKWTAQAGTENAARARRLREACEGGGGPETVAAARAVRDLGDIRLGERSSGDAARLYRDALAILDREGAGESEDAADIAAKLAGLVASTTPASAEAAQLVERALRIRKQAASVPADATPTQDAAIEPAAPAPAADPSEARPDATEAADDDALVLDEPDTPLDPHIRPALLAEE